MKIKIVVATLAFLAVLSFAPSALGQASSGTISTKGPFAETDIFSIDDAGIYREVYIYSSTTTTHVPGGPKANSAVTYAYYFIVDTNTNTLLDEGFGYVDGTLTLGKKFSAASLIASGTLISFFDGSEHSLDVSLDFTANAPAENESVVEHIKFGTLKLLEKFSGTFVTADLAGSFSLDDVDLNTFFFADFGSSKSSQLTISK